MNKAIIVQEGKEIAEGSVSAVAVAKNISLAEAFAYIDRLIMLDGSGSMGRRDVGGDEFEYGGDSRHDAAEQQVRRLQREYPGRTALFCFSDSVEFCPDGVPTRANGLTAMAKALKYLKDRGADGIGIGIDLITDGEPTDGDAAVLEIASTFETPINGIFIGPAYDRGGDFLRELCDRTGGQYLKTKDVGNFYEEERRLLLTQ